MSETDKGDPPDVANESLAGDGLSARVLSGLWRRFLAWVIDALMISLPAFMIGFIFFDSFASLGKYGRVVGFLMQLAYFGIMNSSIHHGQTTGKAIMKIEVVDRNGNHISLPRSLLRNVVLAAPYFMNNAFPFSNPDMSLFAFIALIIFGIAVFGVGVGNTYLCIFNRRTRQGLHDLIAGTYVTRTFPTGHVTGSVWRPHLAIIGVWCVGVAVTMLASFAFLDKGVLADVIPLYTAVESSERYHKIDLQVGKAWQINDKTRSQTNYIVVNAWLKHKPVEFELEARKIASIMLYNHHEINNINIISVGVIYGFDLGIATGWKRWGESHSPEEWRRKIEDEGSKAQE
ncbi:MAG TPA: RDD family protein [Candidatus Brocadiia bacterium]|nr:RDD family protein [Candidatus Brocadiia bacterium]